MSWDNLAIKELEIFVTEMKYVCILLKNETDKTHLTSVSPDISDKELTGGIVLSLQAKVKELEEKIRKLENENEELRLRTESQNKELKRASAGYTRDGKYLRWRDDKTLEWQSYEYSLDFMENRKNIGLWFDGKYTKDGKMIFEYATGNKDEIYPDFFVVMTDKLSEGGAENLLNDLKEKEKYQTTNRIKILTQKFLEKVKKATPRVGDLYNLEVACRCLIQANGDWVSIGKELSACEFDTPPDADSKSLTANKVAHNKVQVLLNASVIDKSDTNVRIKQEIWKEINQN